MTAGVDSMLADLELNFDQLLMSDSGEGHSQGRFIATLRKGEGVEEVSSAVSFRAPLGTSEQKDLRWYLEQYSMWPIGVFKERAERIERTFPKWGLELYRATIGRPEVAGLLSKWRLAPQRRISIYLDNLPPKDWDHAQKSEYRLSATSLFALPWELLCDESEHSFVMQGACVRRRLPERQKSVNAILGGPIRILLLSPRPEDNWAGYIDHRISARPLVEAMASLKGLAELTVLNPPTYENLMETLTLAEEAGQPFHVLHFDGHGICHPKSGRGQLCFEASGQELLLKKRASQLIGVNKLSQNLAKFKLPMVCLEACQSAKAVYDINGSVAARLVAGGVQSVIAMTHSVYIETARRFVTVFYRALASGASNGTAVLLGQQALRQDDYRFEVEAAGKLHLQDWFVPVLYQGQDDPALFSSTLASNDTQRSPTLRLGSLPDTPDHGFLGRSRELLMLERRFQVANYATIIGQSGEGKTTLACELARWLVLSECFAAVAFVAVMEYSDSRSVLDTLGRQLVDKTYSVAHFTDEVAAMAPILAALNARATLVVLDNFESILPAPGTNDEEAMTATESVLSLAQHLVKSATLTRLLFTSRERLPKPFASGIIRLGPLNHDEAIRMVANVLTSVGQGPSEHDSLQEIDELVDVMGCHAHALVLLASELPLRGVKGTLQALSEIFEALPTGDKEKSIFASLELARRRLPIWIQDKIIPLALVHGGCHLYVMSELLNVELEQTPTIAEALIDVGLARNGGDHFLHLNPSLPTFLARMLTPERELQGKERWIAAMFELAHFLLDQHFKDAALSSRLTHMCLPELLHFLEVLGSLDVPEQLVLEAACLEILTANLNCPRAHAKVLAHREAAAARLPDWSHAAFLAESNRIDQILASGDLEAAYDAALILQARCHSCGVEAYVEAGFDHAIMVWKMGSILGRQGYYEAALAQLDHAASLFQDLDADNEDAQSMAIICLSECADQLLSLGRYEAAAHVYEQIIEWTKSEAKQRATAVCMGQLGIVRVKQNRLDEAVEILKKSRALFEQLDEPASVGASWFQLGKVYENRDSYDLAEWAYSQSLAIAVRLKDKEFESSCLNQMGNLYDSMGRLEDAERILRQATKIDEQLKNLAMEGNSRSNLAAVLIRLSHYDKARKELNRAVECLQGYGPGSEEWKVWSLFNTLEQETQNDTAAEYARAQAYATYLSFRRNGGESHTTAAGLCQQVGFRVLQGDDNEIEKTLDLFANNPQAPPSLKLLLTKLRVVLEGGKDMSLADDPGLIYDDAVELRLLLEKCSKAQ